MPSSEARLLAAARRCLPPAVAERWIALIRPAVRLRPAREGEKLVGHLGGVPLLPDDVDWPVWDSTGPLNFVAAIDCRRLQPHSLDIPLPTAGVLNFFYFDATPGDTDLGIDELMQLRAVGVWDPQSLVQGSRIVYTPDDVPASPRSTPAAIAPYEFVPFSGKPTMTGPDWFYPAFQEACRDLSDADREFMDDYANRDTFMSALYELAQPPRHQIGGHALPVQTAVELEVAEGQLGIYPPFNDESRAACDREALRWTLLAQIDFDSTAEAQWDDLGTAYWLMPHEDLAAANFRASSFTRQS